MSDCSCGHSVHDHEADEGCTRCNCGAYKPAATEQRHGTGSGEAKTCPECGYTEADARFNMDHHLCRNAGRAPWEPLSQIVPTPPASPTVTLVYDGPSLPMLGIEHEIYRVQVLRGGKWETLETEQQYDELLALLRAAERHQP